MAKWGSVYFADEKVTDQDIWTCIVSAFSAIHFPFELPEKAGDNFYFQKDGHAISWHNSEDTIGVLTAFNYSGKIDEKDVSFHLLFQKNGTARYKDKKYDKKVRHLVVYEEYDGSGLPMCYATMPLIKRHIKSKFVHDKPVNEMWRIRKRASIITGSRKDRAEEEERKEKQIIESLKGGLPQPEKITPEFIKVKPKKKDIAVDSYEMLIFEIAFYADLEDHFWFDEEWIPRLSADLWFLETNFRWFKGAVSQATSFLLESNPAIRKVLTNRRKYPTIAEKYDKMIADFSRVMLTKDGKIWRETPHIAFAAVGQSPDLTPENTDTSSYEAFRNCIVDALQFDQDTIVKHVNAQFPIFDFKLIDFDADMEQRVDFFLAEHKLDMKSISLLRNAFIETKTENEKLKRELETAKKQHQEDVSRLDEKLRNAALPVSRISDDSEAHKKDIAELKQSLKDGELAIKRLKERVSELENLLTSSEKANANAIVLTIPAELKSLFPCEIEDYLYNLLYSALDAERELLPENRADEANRKRDVVLHLLEKQTFRKETSETVKKHERIALLLKNNSSHDALDSLSEEGFVKVQDSHNHPKYYFYEEKYKTTVAGTPSDFNHTLRMLQNIESCFFLLQ